MLEQRALLSIKSWHFHVYVLSVWSNKEDPAATVRNVDDSPEPCLVSLLFALSHPVLSSSLYLICFPLFCSYPSIILLQCFYLSSCVSWISLKPRLSRCGYGARNHHGSMDLTRTTTPLPPPSLCCAILSRDLLPTRPCWIPAICSTALAFKCLIEPLISWTVAESVCVCVCESWRRLRRNERQRSECLKYDSLCVKENRWRSCVCDLPWHFHNSYTLTPSYYAGSGWHYVKVSD